LIRAGLDRRAFYSSADGNVDAFDSWVGCVPALLPMQPLKMSNPGFVPLMATAKACFGATRRSLALYRPEDGLSTGSFVVHEVRIMQRPTPRRATRAFAL